jgi:predicted RNase H-like nuclease
VGNARVSDGWIAGVDGCRGGWLVVLRRLDAPGRSRVALVPTFAGILVLAEQPRIIAIDIPIGLPETTGIGGRAADSAARAGLGGRQSSVFAVPARAAVMETDYGRACAVALIQSDPPRKISKQTFNLFPKMREVDLAMTPALQTRVRECHPEAAFREMNGSRPLSEPKKLKSRPHAPGLAERRDLLESAGIDLADLDRVRFRSSGVGPDDILDACSCSWTAERIVRGTARCFPDTPPLDARGLRQEIWA